MIGHSPIALLFVQIAVILATCRAVGFVAARVGQPRVMAEMIAGFMLGPSLFGAMAPEWAGTFFPVTSLPTLATISQIGLVLYMFCVGLEFRSDLVLSSGRRALSLSVAGIAGPLLLGAWLALGVLRPAGGLFADDVTSVQAALFMGTALSITAFPMLARIIGECGIAGTAIGTLALTAGAIDDALAWMLLAIVLGLVRGSPALAAVAVAGGAGYAAFTLWGGPRLGRWLSRRDTSGERTPIALTSVLCLLMLGAFFTERVGMHAVFGAFVFGVSFRRSALAGEIREIVEPLATTLFVPIFFAYAGLQTQLGLLDSAQMWLIALAIFVTACVGKSASCGLGAYSAGATVRESLALGVLMNTRGMVELILIDIGRSQGLITPALYTMLVLMAIGTTLMTGPLFNFIWRRSAVDVPHAESFVTPPPR